jgi:ABC-2 type transport system ATP-binding protein
MNASVRSLLAGVVVVAALVGAPAAFARDAIVTSFDGTPISASFFPAQGLVPGQKAPTILETHGWGAMRDKDENSATLAAVGQVGLGPLRRAGFNVLTWDSRGFGESGGDVEVDSQSFEGRDVSALLDWLATQPEQQLDAAGDPRAGMTGASYAGGIELVAAGIDHRIDAIAPDIAWHSLLTALYREDLVKGGWAAALSGLGIPTATALGVISPAGVQTGTVDPHITSALTEGLATGHLSDEDRAWFESRGPGDALVSRIRVPTLLVQGTADTLFTPSEAIRNQELLKAAGVPVHMLWFCGGHGVCLTQGDNSRVETRIVGWLRRWLMDDHAADGDPAFEWLADDGQWRSAADWPMSPGPALTAQGSGTLTFSPADTQSSGLAVAATPSANAVDVAIPSPAGHVDAVGEPKLALDYQGTATDPRGYVFAQIVDEQRHLVLGNQVTPIAVTLDGLPHSVSRALEGVAAAIEPGAHYTLQIVGGSSVYGPVRSAGSVQLKGIRLTMPSVDPAATRAP